METFSALMAHRWPVNTPHKGQWRGALMFSLIWAWINGWVNKREAGDLRRHRVHYDVIVMPEQGRWTQWLYTAILLQAMLQKTLVMSFEFYSIMMNANLFIKLHIKCERSIPSNIWQIVVTTFTSLLQTVSHKTYVTAFVCHCILQCTSINQPGTQKTCRIFIQTIISISMG